LVEIKKRKKKLVQYLSQFYAYKNEYWEIKIGLTLLRLNLWDCDSISLFGYINKLCLIDLRPHLRWVI
jgi:hypothetical protein